VAGAEELARRKSDIFRIGCWAWFFALAASGQVLTPPVITIDPALVTECASAGLGQVTVEWNYPGSGPVVVHVNSASGPAMTGPSNASGSATTGDWVTDGMVFVLTDASENELDRAGAHVQCAAAAVVLAPALAAAPYFPLQVGDEWLYLYNSRFGTGDYRLRRITEAQIMGGTVWFVMEESVSGSTTLSDTLYRIDSMGRVYQMTTQGEELWLDPTSHPDPSAVLTIQPGAPSVQTPAGQFMNTINYSSFSGLISENGTFARGIGLLNSSSQIIAGSSGGFDQSYTLIYARIDGNLVFGSPGSAIELSADAASFDVTHQLAPNCALPCYFAACGLGGAQPDPPGTYKPCFGARVYLGQTSSAAASIDFDLLDKTSNSLYHTTATAQPIVEQQIQLYSAPNQPFPTGTYQLRAKTADGRTATVPITVQ